MNKRKDAQKLASYALTEIQAKSTVGNTKTKNDKYIGALENAFGNLELKSNWLLVRICVFSLNTKNFEIQIEIKIEIDFCFTGFFGGGIRMKIMVVEMVGVV